MHVKDVENMLLTASCQHFLVPRDPSEFVVEIDVRIDRYDGNQEQTVQIGGASLFSIDERRVLDYGESLLEVMDAHSQELTDVYSALFDAEGDYWEEFEEQDFLGRAFSISTSSISIQSTGVMGSASSPCSGSSSPLALAPTSW